MQAMSFFLARKYDIIPLPAVLTVQYDMVIIFIIRRHYDVKI